MWNSGGLTARGRGRGLWVALVSVLLTSCPIVTHLTPSSSPAGSDITIRGAGFGGSQGSSTLRYDGAAMAVVSWSDAEIVATVPDPKPAGTYAIVLTVGGSALNLSHTIPAGPPPVGQVTNLEPVYSETVMDSTGPKTEPAICPSGKSLLGGGASLTSGVVGLSILESAPNAALDRWVGSGQEVVATEDDWSLQTTAMCGNALGYEVVTETGSIASDFATSLSASCPAGKIMIGGGARFLGAASTVALQSMQVNGSTNGALGLSVLGRTSVITSDAWGIEVQLVCAHPPPPANGVLESFIPPDSTDSKSLDSPECPSGFAAIGGGVNIINTPPGTTAKVSITASEPVELSNPPVKWHVAAHEIVPTSESWGLLAQVICVPIQ